jgi:hypothetical protein
VLRPAARLYHNSPDSAAVPFGAVRPRPQPGLVGLLTRAADADFATLEAYLAETEANAQASRASSALFALNVQIRVTASFR